MPKPLATNKDLRSFEIVDRYEAGIMLTGAEVKSAKAGAVSLKGSYVTIQGDEAFLINAHIARYKPAGEQPEYDPRRDRKLLLHKKEIASLTGKSHEKGLTLMASKMYTRHSKVKVEVVVARGLRKYDRREKIKKAEADRKIQRALRQKRY